MRDFGKLYIRTENVSWDAIVVIKVVYPFFASGQLRTTPMGNAIY